MIPAWDANDNLPPGIHSATWNELEQHLGFNPKRQRLLDGLRRAIDALRVAGCEDLFVDGSFITKKPLPGDFDACWSINNVDPALLDPVLIDFSQGRAAQKQKYLGELFPAQWPADAAGTVFIDFFQQDRNGNPKGVLHLDLRRWP
ncbi:MAG: hypothetical protein HC933_19855 [Pleurocapsa sp. SU_196_0]|nr:hypothetical protein [Pleurocapsa sp. SU_196_0]